MKDTKIIKFYFNYFEKETTDKDCYIRYWKHVKNEDKLSIKVNDRVISTRRSRVNEKGTVVEVAIRCKARIINNKEIISFRDTYHAVKWDKDNKVTIRQNVTDIKKIN